MTRDTDDALWLDALLRDARPAPLEDDGFSTGVLARIALPAPTLPPQAALAALRRAQRDERRHNRWTIGGFLVGAAVAAVATWLGGTPDVAESTTTATPVIVLLVVSCGLAWWAIAVKRDDALW